MPAETRVGWERFGAPMLSKTKQETRVPAGTAGPTVRRYSSIGTDAGLHRADRGQDLLRSRRGDGWRVDALDVDTAEQGKGIDVEWQFVTAVIDLGAGAGD